MSIEHATIFFLIAVFIIAEVYRIRRGRRGIIVSANGSHLAGVALPVFQVEVELRDGRRVNAAANCCTACLGQLKVGDEVVVTSSRDGYVVDLPWMRSRQRCTGTACEG
ncbi:MAG: hypothetical protein AB1473_13025 [Thermodesulfobacteriota bacterium]